MMYQSVNACLFFSLKSQLMYNLLRPHSFKVQAVQLYFYVHCVHIDIIDDRDIIGNLKTSSRFSELTLRTYIH